MHLIIFTDSYPFEDYEPFVRNEVDYLSQEFDRIDVLSSSKSKNIQVDLPKNIVVTRFETKVSKSDRFRWLMYLFDPILWNEISFGLNYKKAKKKEILREVIYSLNKADKLFKKIASKVTFKKDQIFYTYWTDYRTLACVLLKRKYPSIKIISRAHGWDVYFERHPSNYLPFRKLFSQKLDAFVFISQNGLRYTRKIIGESRDKKMICSHLGIDRTRSTPKNTTITNLKIYSCSSVIKIKRIDRIIHTLALINDYNIEWHHFGSGPLEDNMIALAKYLLSEKPNVKYRFWGHIDNRQLLSIIQDQDYHLLINVSEYEGIPLTMMEAMSCSIPVIGMNKGGVSEIIRHGFNGFLLNVSDEPLVIADTLVSIINMKDEEYQLLRKNAFETWETSFQATINYGHFCKMIKDLLPNSPK